MNQEKIRALTDGEKTKGVRNIRLTKALEEIIERISDDLFPMRVDFTARINYFTAMGIVALLEERAKAGKPILEIEFSGDRVTFSKKRG